eukprot:c8935_g1_i2 orf=483-911(-)
MAKEQIHLMTAGIVFCLLCGFFPVNDSKEIIVGGAKQWRFGFNYTQWAETSGPFQLNDILVFRYKPFSFGAIHVNHNVMLLQTQKELDNCRFDRSQLVANSSDGYTGFKFQLTEYKPYYFACGEARGYHCRVGLMKFMAMPV